MTLFRSGEPWRRRADINSLGLAVLLVLVAGLFAVGQDNDRQIQESRADIAQDSCRAQNERHDNTVGRLDARIGQLSGRARVRADRSRDFTVSLIEALAPRRDCKRLVEQIRSAAD